MSNHFTGLSLGPPLGDQRLDLCDLYAFTSPSDPDRTVLILNANPNAGALHPDAVYRINIDNDGDLRTDIALSFVYSELIDGRQTVSVYLAYDDDAEATEAVGSRIFEDIEVSFGSTPNVARSGSFAFFFDFDGIKNLFDITGGRNFTAPHLGGESPWTGVDSNLAANVFSMAFELPTAALGPDPDLRIWGRCSVWRDGELALVDPDAPFVDAYGALDRPLVDAAALELPPRHIDQRRLPAVGVDSAHRHVVGVPVSGSATLIFSVLGFCRLSDDTEL